MTPFEAIEFTMFVAGYVVGTVVAWAVNRRRETPPGTVRATYYDGSTKDFTPVAWKMECDRQRRVREDLKATTPFLAAYDPRHQFGGGDTVEKREEFVARAERSRNFTSTPLPVENYVVDYDKLKKMLEDTGFKNPEKLIKTVKPMGTCGIDSRPHVKYPNCENWTPVEARCSESKL